MSGFILGPGEKIVQCPYNLSHHITNAKLLVHLERCRKSYLKTMYAQDRKPEMKICRFNHLHHYPALEIKFHEERCSDAGSVVKHLAYHNSEEANQQYAERHQQNNIPSEDVKPVINDSGEVGDEDWDAECTGNSAGYDPSVKLKNEVIIYNPSGGTKSERKKFRQEYREIAAEKTENGGSVELPTAASFEIKPDIKNVPIKSEQYESRTKDRSYDRDDSYSRSSGSSRNDYSSSQNYRRSTGGHSSSSGSTHQSSYSKQSSYKSHYDSQSSSNSWSRRNEPEFSEDDFEGDDPYA